MVLGSVSDTLSQLIRTILIPTPGNKFIDADFSSIEARVLAWLAGESWSLEVFRTHGKIYEAQASANVQVCRSKRSEKAIRNTHCDKKARSLCWLSVIRAVSAH